MTTRGRTVLVVEDNADHALLVQLAARRVQPDLDIRRVADGVQAVAYLGGARPYEDRKAHPRPSLVILDLTMPNLDGFGVLEWVKAQESLASLPVVILTSSENPSDEARAMKAGARAFYTKPASLDDLGREVRNIVERWLP